MVFDGYCQLWRIGGRCIKNILSSIKSSNDFQ